MDGKELKTFTWDDVRSFTWDQLLMDKLELLKKAASDDLVLPDPVWEKLISLCRKTIEDYNEAIPDCPLSIGASDLPAKKIPYSKLIEIVVTGLISEIIRTISTSLFPTTPQQTINNYNNYYITVEQSQVLQTDVNEILATLSNAIENSDNNINPIN